MSVSHSVNPATAPAPRPLGPEGRLGWPSLCCIRSLSPQAQGEGTSRGNVFPGLPCGSQSRSSRKARDWCWEEDGGSVFRASSGRTAPGLLSAREAPALYRPREPWGPAGLVRDHGDRRVKPAYSFALFPFLSEGSTRETKGNFRP